MSATAAVVEALNAASAERDEMQARHTNEILRSGLPEEAQFVVAAARDSALVAIGRAMLTVGVFCGVDRDAAAQLLMRQIREALEQADKGSAAVVDSAKRGA